MKFLAFLFALVALYALVQAKGDILQRKESPLRKALRSKSQTQLKTRCFSKGTIKIIELSKSIKF